MIPLLVLLACAGRTPAPEGPVASEEAAAPECVAACLQRAASPTEDPEVTERRCREECGQALPLVTSEADIAGKNGERVVVEGTLRQVRIAKGPRNFDVTIVDLVDGTDLLVTYSAPPHGWEGLLGARIRVEGTLWEGPPDEEKAQALLMPHLTDVDAPLPVEIGSP